MILLAAHFLAAASGTTDCQHGPCGPGNDLCVGSTPTRFVFHLSDVACDINDPNGPFYDPVHKMYHNFYQDHLAEPDPVGLKAGQGPDWGHWVSRDFLHWARLPVAIWNDRWYDNVAIFSGSATIVDGKPVIVYPGKCHGASGTPAGEACSTGFTYDVAVPANASDPLYTNWTKPSYNPIVNQTGDDPSTAWQTPAGEWRLIGNQKCDGVPNGAPIYGSMDFQHWYKVGCTTLLLGDCPTFFPLPPLVPGTAETLSPAQLAALPTHVHKAGSNSDQLQAGTWTDGKPGPASSGGTPGTWVQQGASVPLDNGATHASKDFWDPVKQRRIMWVWATIHGGAQTVPRDMTFDPRTGRVVYNPVEEIAALRSASPIGTLGRATLNAEDAALVLTSDAAADVEIVWKRPTVEASLQAAVGNVVVRIDYVPPPSGEPTRADDGTTNYTVQVSCGGRVDDLPLLSNDTTITLRLLVDTAIGEAYFQNGRVAITFPLALPTNASPSSSSSSPTNVSLSVRNVTFTPSRAYEYMPGYDLGGDDYHINNTFGAHNTDPTTCQRLCEAAAPKCKAWTFVNPGVQDPQARCCLKDQVPHPSAKPGITSGALGTGPMPHSNATTNAVATLTSATAWSMGSIWTTAAEVLATPPTN